jgi:acyl-CoA thioester hydrolase
MESPVHVFELTIVVEAADIDQLGHANNVTWVRWVQDAAVAHWRAAAPAEDQEKLLWIVLRHEIDYHQPAHEGDRMIARTWVGNAKGLRFERFTEFRREGEEKLLVRARTVWCPIDAHRGRPVAVSDAVRARFSVDAERGTG